MMIEQVKVSVLVDNKAEEGFACEHGLSFWLEVKDEDGGVRKILFDTGKGKALKQNVLKMGIDVGEAECLVLSHGHYDHTGGLDYVMGVKEDMKVYCHSCAELERYSIGDPEDGGATRLIDMPEQIREVFKGIKRRGQITWTDEGVMLGEGIGVTGFVERESELEDVGGPFYLDKEGKVADLIEDDQTMWFKTKRGLVIVAGCSHSGVINTMKQIQRVSGVEKVYALIGGLHLVNADEKRVNWTCEQLEEIGVERICACHCTGEGAMEVMKDRFGEKFEEVKAGKVFEF